MKPRPIADLLLYRVSSEHPFDTTGIDYAGPFLVKDVYTQGPGMIKSYIYYCLHVLRQDVVSVLVLVLTCLVLVLNVHI